MDVQTGRHGRAGFGDADAEMACRLSNHSLPDPDIAVVRAERAQAMDPDAFFVGAPDLAIEVASPGNRKLASKAELYLEHGAEQVWIVYPKTRTVLVMTREGSTEARMGERIAFRGVPIAVNDIFPALGQAH